ncbi:MAG: hypothetical protein V9G19_01740 [Tetrasphaera sp.]
MPRLPTRPTLPSRPIRHLSAATDAARVVAGRLAPGLARAPLSFAGWSTAEFRSYAASPSRSATPQRRAGRDAVTRVNAATGNIPIEAALLARAIADTAPPVGVEPNPTLWDVLERYLPDCLSAFEVSSRRAGRESAEQLLIAQLRLLHSVALNVEQAEAEHNERDLQIQDRFLKERFASLTPGELDLTVRPPATASIRALDAAGKTRAKAAPTEGRAYLDAEADPVVLFRRQSPGPWELGLRLALPRRSPVTLGVVEESTTGAMQFTHRAGRRVFTQRRATGFRAAQVDLTLAVRLSSPRRFLVYAEGLSGREPTDTVLFLRADTRSQAELATTLANHPRAPLTVIASGYETTDGLIVRNESILFPDLRAACDGYGYRRITWLDRHSPVV